MCALLLWQGWYGSYMQWDAAGVLRETVSTWKEVKCGSEHHKSTEAQDHRYEATRLEFKVRRRYVTAYMK